MMTDSIPALARKRWSIAIALTVLLIVIYFGFILAIAFDKELMSRLVAPGLSLGILVGALVIVAAWLLTWIYVRWANRHYDPHLARLQARDER